MKRNKTDLHMAVTSHNVSYDKKLEQFTVINSNKIISARSMLTAIVGQATPEQCNTLMASLGFVWQPDLGLWVTENLSITDEAA